MRSMTGFGRGVAEQGGARATVDIRAVNHRFLDVKLRGNLAPQTEDAIGARVKAGVERGALTISVQIGRSDTPPGNIAISGPTGIDHAAAAAAYESLATLARELGIPGPDLKLVLAQPGVVMTELPLAGGSDAIHAAVLAATDLALVQLAEMRAVEGAALAIELTARLDGLAGAGATISELATNWPVEQQRKLADRVRKLVAEADVGDIDPHRIALEVAMLADRADITEELVRLASHLDQARALVADAKPSGRRLDFLAQEIGRELNTIGSKASSTEITTGIVHAKALLEKLREQIQNVE